MGEVSTIGLDIAKSVFQVHGVDSAGAVMIRRRIGRAKVLDDDCSSLRLQSSTPCMSGWKADSRRRNCSCLARE
jgi:hypothetical protein